MNLIIELLKQNQTISEKKNTSDNNESLIIELLKQNQGFKELMMEQNKYMLELAKNAGNNTNCNNTNNKFNMQIFLNETCKDAMNITEFVNSLVLTFKDLEDLGRYGYTQGITNIFTRGLQATEVSKRPIHCSDIKRLIIYINDVNGWEKDNSSQEKVIQLIRKIAGKNLRQATEWMKINHSMIHGPDSHEQRQYLKMISQWFGGTDEENVKIYNKIIRNIAPQCYIDKYPALN
jgi:ATP-dependent Clp protease adapter protein ClpS